MNGEDFYECPGCLHTIPISEIEKNIHAAGTERKVQKVWGDRMIVTPPKEDEDDTSVGGDSTDCPSLVSSEESWADESDDGKQWWSGMRGSKVNYSIS